MELETKYLVVFSPDQIENETLTLAEIDEHPARHLIIQTTPIGELTRDNIGTFKIPNKFLSSENIHLALRVLKDVVVVRAEQIYSADSIEYCGLSKHFKAVKDGCQIPEYNVVVDDLSVKFQLVE